MSPEERLYLAHLHAEGLMQCSNAQKQAMGRDMAAHIGFRPGPAGPDGGIDGVVPMPGDVIAHFSSKLSSSPLDVYEAKLHYADLLRHRAAVSVIVAGIGYKGTFTAWLSRAPHLETVRLHMLTLSDVLAETDAFQRARRDVPPVDGLTAIDWRRFRD